MIEVIQQIINGLTIGGVYALIALGIVVVNNEAGLLRMPIGNGTAVGACTLARAGVATRRGRASAPHPTAPTPPPGAEIVIPGFMVPSVAGGVLLGLLRNGSRLHVAMKPTR